MEKILIKPTAQEILIKGSPQEGHADVFSYNYDLDEDKTKLGNLFIIGNVCPSADGEGATDESDVTYVTNLVASLAKREYYSDPALSPKEALSLALKKINDVVEEFFKSKDASINIGVFAISGDSIMISKLGKFKIFLCRDNKNIDILNNVDLFSKERTEDKKFSNIISGKVASGDKILAFYPGKSITSREKLIKTSFLKLKTDQFIEKINSIKKDKENFACAAICIDVSKYKETAVIQKPQPAELKEKTPLPMVNLEAGEAILAARNGDEAHLKTAEIKQPEEMPRIIPSEFSLGRKDNYLSSFINKMKISDYNPRKKIIYFALAIIVAGIVLSVSLLVKSVIVANSDKKQLNLALKETETNLKVAQTKISENYLQEARNILASSFAAIKSLSETDQKKSENTMAEILSLMDNIDQAVQASPALVSEIPSQLGKINLISSAGNILYAYISEETTKDTVGKNYLVKLNGNSIGDKYEIKDTQPSSVFTNNDAKYSYLIDNSGGKITVVSLSDNKVKTISPVNMAPLINTAFYEDNLYILNSDKISKISDVSAAKGQIQTWTQGVNKPTADSILIAVDGKIFVLDKSGVLTTFYKGKKENEKNIAISPDDGSLLLTTKDSKNLYLINKNLARIYVINKETATLVKTIKLGSSEPIITASINSSETIIFLTKDNKIWKVGP